MFVFHTIWINDGSKDKIYVWIESSDMFYMTRKVRPHHPFAIPDYQLSELFKAIFQDSKRYRWETESVTLILPTVGNMPLPSKELLLNNHISDYTSAELKEWMVNCYTLSGIDALNFLLGLPEQPPANSAYGSTLKFWKLVAKFTMELLVKQNFIPVIKELDHSNSEKVIPLWQAYIDDENDARLKMLASMMPPVARSFVLNNVQQSDTSINMVKNFVNLMIDSFIRESINDNPVHYRKYSKMKIEGYNDILPAFISKTRTYYNKSHDEKRFSEQLATWSGTITDAINSPFKTCFRLEPPEDEENDTGQWRISFHLQAHDDPTVLISADKVWNSSSSVIKFINRKFENPHERLLSDLARASKIYPVLNNALEQPAPTEVGLQDDQAYTFIKEVAPLLQQSGFGIIFPSWYVKNIITPKIKLKMKTESSLSSGLLGLNQLATFDWEIAIGDEHLTLSEFEKLVDLKVPLVNINGRWVEVNASNIQKAIDFFTKKKNITVGEALRLNLSNNSKETGLPLGEIEADGWLGNFLSNIGKESYTDIEKIDKINHFTGTLRPYQNYGVEWLTFLRKLGLGGCLADDMGLGKTIEILAMLQHHKNNKEIWGPSLLICPMSIVGNWERELKNFTPELKYMVHHGGERLSGNKFMKAIKNVDLVITTYSIAYRDEKHLSGPEWNYIILDEAQNIKNVHTKQRIAIKKFKGLHKITLTGTPVENRLNDLWSIIDFINPGYLGTIEEFKENYGTSIERYHDQERTDTLRRLLSPFILRRLKTDPKIISDLPQKMEMKVYCNLTKEQATLYGSVVKDMLDKIENSEGITRKGLVLSTLLKLKQVCNHPALFLHDQSKIINRSGKVERLVEMLEEAISEGDKSLVFTQYAEMGTILQEHLQNRLNCEVLYLHGSTPKKQRDIMINHFQSGKESAPVFILSIKAGGQGLNLTAANRIFHFDRWWNPAVENQATDRAFRIGQKKNVIVHKYISAGTLEEKIDQMLEQKKNLADKIVGSFDNKITELSTVELKKLLTLSKDSHRGG